MTARILVLAIIYAAGARLGFYLYQRYLMPIYRPVALESPEAIRHRKCLEHTAELEKELGLYRYPSFAEVHNLRDPDGSWRTPNSQKIARQ